MEEAFDNVMKGSLKLKGIGRIGATKKKKKTNKAKEVLETIVNVEETIEASSSKEKESKPVKTPAEMAFDETQKKRQKERIMKKAAQSHKQRVEELNSHLDNLSEHYDIPKVSWTK